MFYCILLQREALNNSNFIDVGKFYINILKMLYNVYTTEIPSTLQVQLMLIYVLNARSVLIISVRRIMHTRWTMTKGKRPLRKPEVSYELIRLLIENLYANQKYPYMSYYQIAYRKPLWKSSMSLYKSL